MLFQGTYEELLKQDTPTAYALAHATRITSRRREAQAVLKIQDAASNNLRHIDVDIPKGVLVAVAGVAGSGKSSLIEQHLVPALAENVAYLDQSVIKGNRRSSIASYTGLLDHLRKKFAKLVGQDAGLFSSNSLGACPVCKGAGVIETQLGFMETITTHCAACHGSGYSDETLSFTVGEKNIYDILNLSAREAAVLFSTKGDLKIPACARICQRMVDAGVGYLKLSQALPTLSGGERQRLKLACQLDDSKEWLILDEPSDGLHLQDADALIAYLNRLVDEGKSVVVIEHNLDIIAAADWVLELGVGGGSEGGALVFEGTPHELAHADTPTGNYLARALA